MSALPELPEPDGELTIVVIGREVQIDAFRASTMREYGQASRKAALKDAHELVTGIVESNELVSNTQGTQAADDCLTAIEGLMK